MLTRLFSEAWDQFDDFKRIVHKRSIPVLYFGDIHAYRASPLKIATLGKNPSRLEFEENHVPTAGISRRTASKYFETLNDYFRPHRSPYRHWFDNYERVLNGMEASYYGSKARTAIHTDLCSPLATRKSWSDPANNDVRNALLARGMTLWESLMRQLKPNIIIASFRWDYVAKQFGALNTWSFWKVPRKDYEIRMCRTGEYGNATVFFGRAAQCPFGPGLTFADKEDIGRFLIRLYDRTRGKRPSKD